jgi:hypothetical protein
MMGRSMRTMSAALAAVLLSTATSLYAQGTPAAPREFFRGYVLFDSTSLAAADTFDAVIGKSRLSMTGGGGEVLGLWKGLFARVAFSSVDASGSRVEVYDGDVFPLGIPLTVELRPLELAGGWRFAAAGGGRVVPYAGGGLLRMGYRETSDFALAGENVDATYSGTLAFGGVDVRLVSWLFGGAEVQYRSVPDALGAGGASEAFGENNLGGFTFRVLVGVRR